jgi:hypothetical protein
MTFCLIASETKMQDLLLFHKAEVFFFESETLYIRKKQFSPKWTFHLETQVKDQNKNFFIKIFLDRHFIHSLLDR